MSKTRFISDLHLGHKQIAEFSGPWRGGVKTMEEHEHWLIEQWNQVVSKRDVVFVLGDVCFDKEKLPLLRKLKGTKHLLIGNHDKFSAEVYKLYFNKS